MAIIVEGQLPYTGGTGVDIDANKVISVLLREEDNLIKVNNDNELYTDLQLAVDIEPDDDFPVGVTVGKVLEDDGWTQNGLLLNWKTTSGDYARWIYGADGKIYFDGGTGDWNQVYYSSEVDGLFTALRNSLADVAFSGDYNDLRNRPEIPVVFDGTLTIQKNGTTVGDFTANQQSDETINITMDKTDVGLGNVDNTSDLNKPISTATQTALDGKQATLVSGTNIKTINNTSVLGSGNIDTNQVSDTAYGSSWDGATTTAPSKNAVYDKINSIDALIPSTATSSNQLTDKNYVDDSINSVSAYYITKNAQGDAFATKAELTSATTFYSGGITRTPTRNDYCIVLADETHSGECTRYSYQGTQWEYQYTVNESPMSQAQLDALNSGITSTKVGQYDTAVSTIAGYGNIVTHNTSEFQGALTPSTGISIDASNNISNTLPGPTVSSTAPSSPSEGALWYDTANDMLKAYNGTSWEDAGTKMVVLSYGSSTWNDFINAYDKNAIVYCRASSNTNPGTGVQGRMAFMAFVNISGTTVTSVEFQYYRSVSSHSASQQGDQVFIYKLENTNGGTWSVTTREASSKIVAGTGLSSSYSSGTLTITNAGVTSVNSNTGAVTVNDTKIASTAPTSPSEGMLWYDTSNDVLKVYNGSSWTLSDFNVLNWESHTTTEVKIFATKVVSKASNTAIYSDGTGTIPVGMHYVDSYEVSGSTLGLTTFNNSSSGGVILGYFEIDTSSNTITWDSASRENYILPDSNGTVGQVFTMTANGANRANPTGKEYNAGPGIEIGTYNNYSAMRGPCDEGFHVPLTTEWQAIYNIWTNLGGGSSDGTNFGIALKMPFSGIRNYLTSNTSNQSTSGRYWSSNHVTTEGSNSAYGFSITSSNINASATINTTAGYSIRGFKDSPIVPTSSWTKLYGTSIEAGGIFWSSADGLISLSSDGQTWITIADKNLGATQVWNSGDTLSEDNCGYYYQWGNNYGFPRTGTITNTSSTQVNTTGYGPGNYYLSSTFITGDIDWSNPKNNNLRGGETGAIIIENAITNTGVLSVNGQTGDVTVASPDMSNYLAKDNTTAYTPSGDYNPATKKYVDDRTPPVQVVSSLPANPTAGVVYIVTS